MQDSMQLYKAYYAGMHACPSENPAAGEEDFVDAAGKLWFNALRGYLNASKLIQESRGNNHEEDS